MKIARILKLLPLLFAALILAGCNISYFQNVTKSSLVEFLFPDAKGHVETPRIPHLNLPLRVGLAFTPSNDHGFSEVDKSLLAENVAKQFRSLDFVSNIEIIPSDYLRARGGFANVDQLKRLFNIDVIVLLSYDQSTFTTYGFASLSYWTIVGAYVIQGDKNDTQTLIDAAVFDIDSRALLFRAPGTSVIKTHSTLVANSDQVHGDSNKGFNDAGGQLITNLKNELVNFKQKVKDNPERYQVTRSEGYSGGANDGIFLILIVLAIAVTTGTRGRQRK